MSSQEIQTFKTKIITIKDREVGISFTQIDINIKGMIKMNQVKNITIKEKIISLNNMLILQKLFMKSVH